MIKLWNFSSKFLFLNYRNFQANSKVEWVTKEPFWAHPATIVNWQTPLFSSPASYFPYLEREWRAELNKDTEGNPKATKVSKCHVKKSKILQCYHKSTLPNSSIVTAKNPVQILK